MMPYKKENHKGPYATTTATATATATATKTSPKKKRIRTVGNLIALIPTLAVSLACVSRTTIYFVSDFFLSRRRPFSVSSLIL